MATPHVLVTGGLLCGTVRYESKVPPSEGFYCHCTICQKNYGGSLQRNGKGSRRGFQAHQG